MQCSDFVNVIKDLCELKVSKMQKVVEFEVELPVQSTSIKPFKLSSEQFYDINVGEKLTNIQLGFFGM